MREPAGTMRPAPHNSGSVPVDASRYFISTIFRVIVCCGVSRR